MTYSVSFNTQFAIEFANYPGPQQTAILTFAKTFEQHGLRDFSRFEGKIAPSWSSLPSTDPVYNYTLKHSLWHYHIGIPSYRTVHGRYKTSDVVLHFEWPNRGSKIHLVDTYDHLRSDGTFYIPPPEYLKKN